MDVCGSGVANNINSVVSLHLPIALATGFLLLLGGYLVSVIIQNEKIKLWVREELWNLLANGVILWMLFGLIGVFSSSLTSSSSMEGFISSIAHNPLPSGDCLYGMAHSYTLQLIAEVLKVDAVITWASLHFNYLADVSSFKCIFSGSGKIGAITRTLCMLGAPTISYNPYLDIRWIAGTLMSFSGKFIASVYTLVFSQAVLLNLVFTPQFLTLLAYTAVLKIIPFTRQFANVIFATLFGFLVFYPLLVIVEAPILGAIDFTPGIDRIGIAVDVNTASELEGLRTASTGDLARIFLLGSSLTDIWEREYDSTLGACLKYHDTRFVCLNPLLNLYSLVIFKTLLFGSINFITVAVVIRGVLSLTNDTDNLMEMFIRMTGIITW